jgi:hypothetical protein
MAHAAPVRTKIPTKSPQPARAGAARPARPKARRPARSRVLAGGSGRPATRGDGDPVIELECGITVYPSREGQGRLVLRALKTSATSSRAVWARRAWCSGWGAWRPPGELVVPGRVEGQVAEQFAGGGADEACRLPALWRPSADSGPDLQHHPHGALAQLLGVLPLCWLGSRPLQGSDPPRSPGRSKDLCRG